MLVLLFVQIINGMISRSAPALNLFALGLPAGTLAGITALIVALPILLNQFARLIEVALQQTAGLAQAGGLAL